MQNDARFLITASPNLNSLDNQVSSTIVKLEVTPPKIVICHLIFFNIFHNNKIAVIFFLVKILS